MAETLCRWISGILLLAVITGCVAAVPSEGSSARMPPAVHRTPLTPEDSASIFSSIGTALRSERVRVLQAILTCPPDDFRCPGENRDARFRAIAEALDVELQSDPSAALPPCPWPLEAIPPNAGYRLSLTTLRIAGSEATVGLSFQCSNPRGYVHTVFQRIEHFTVRRIKGDWTVTERQVRMIT